ncbi:MAG: DNA-directed RNA polymerase subunit D [Candidatus Bathyarchaeia archaeon]
MEVTILKVDGDKASFILRGADPAMANALRRAMIAEVPTMAIDDVMILENTSPMYDEILAHRLGLVPLTTDLDSYNLPEECSCGAELGCSKCRATLTLEAEAAGEAKTIYSRDLEPQDPAIHPVSPGIPLVKLAPGQKVKLEAYARLGRGREHAKWQPVSVCAYKYYPIIAVDDKICDACGICAEYCPKGILAVEEGKLRVTDELKCTMCNECARHCPKNPPAIRISWDDTAFIFNVESTGSLKIERIVLEAARILTGKLETLKELMSNKLEEELDEEA